MEIRCGEMPSPSNALLKDHREQFQQSSCSLLGNPIRPEALQGAYPKSRQYWHGPGGPELAKRQLWPAPFQGELRLCGHNTA